MPNVRPTVATAEAVSYKQTAIGNCSAAAMTKAPRKNSVKYIPAIVAAFLTAELSRVSRDSSGGENQAPFYVAICASLLQIYQKSENSIRLVLLDEAFSKMTSDRIRPMMELFRRLQLQVLLISTVEKSTAIQPYCDITYSIVRHGNANAIAPFVRLSAE